MLTWLHRVVIGERLCPFAKPSLEREGFELYVSAAETFEEAYRDFLTYLTRFLQPSSAHIESGLLVLSRALSDFEEYLDCLAVAEEALEELELSGVVQIASFHPDYRFADTPPDDPAHWTNRAPLPAFHLLREDAMSEALESIVDPDLIPQRNIERLRGMTPEALRALFEGL